MPTYTPVRTRIGKNMRGNIEAVDQYDTDFGKTMEVTTMKVSSGELVTSVKCGKHTDHGNGFVSFEYASSDYYECIARTRSRCTENNVRAQHASVNIEAQMDKARAYYAAKGK